MPDTAALDMGTNGRFQPALSATTDAPTLSTVSKEESTPATTTDPVVEKPTDKGVDSTQAAPEKAKPDDSATSNDESGTDSAANAKSKGGFQKRIDELTKQREESKREKEDYARRLDEALKLLERNHPPREEPQTRTKDTSEPQREQFETPDDYAKALSQWSTKQAIEQYRAEETRKAEETRSAGEFQKVLTDWNSAKAKAIEKYPDYESVAENPDIQVAQHVGMAVLNVSNGHDVLYWLGQHPAEASRISALQAPFAAIEIGRLSERLSASAPVSKAPAPTKPLAGNANDAGKVAPEDDPGYMERRLQEMRKRK
jgi:hypothetical protein